MKSRKSYFMLSAFFLIIGCGELEVPEPEYYKGWERLTVQKIDWPKDCYLPDKYLIVGDTIEMKQYRCTTDFSKVDFSKFDILLYNEGSFSDITEIKVQSYLYINHQLKEMRLEAVSRALENRSGLSTNGFTTWANHCLLIPKVPVGYVVKAVNK